MTKIPSSDASGREGASVPAGRIGPCPVRVEAAVSRDDTADQVGRLYRVEAPHFCAGLIVRSSRIVEAEPALEWALGMTFGELVMECGERAWKLTLVLQPEIEPVWRKAKRLMEEMDGRGDPRLGDGVDG